MTGWMKRQAFVRESVRRSRWKLHAGLDKVTRWNTFPNILEATGRTTSWAAYWSVRQDVSERLNT